VENYKECGILNSTGRRIFVGVEGGVTDLIKSVTHQVLAERLSSLAFIDFQLQIYYYCLLESVPVKPTRERL
jgi:hypothetical protein